MKTKKRKHVKRPRRLSSRRSYRRNPGGEFDSHAATELELYIDNDRDLHRQSFTPIIANLVKKMRGGKYSPALAQKLWAYHIKRGADKYAREFGTRGETGTKMFNKATRDYLAKRYESHNRPQVEQEAGSFGRGGYRSNPKRKHARKSRRKSVRRVKHVTRKPHRVKHTLAHVKSRMDTLRAFRNKFAGAFKRCKTAKKKREYFLKINRIDQLMRIESGKK